MSYKIAGDVSEAQVEANVAMYLGWVSRCSPVHLLSVDEQVTGADKLYDNVLPIYIQFKKSNGLTPLALNSNRRINASKLQTVREFRHRNGLPDNPTLYFQLRRKAKKATDLQHNILLSHQVPGNSFAVYVAPLFLDRVEYHNCLFACPKYFRSPYFMKSWLLYSDHSSGRLLSWYDEIPFFRGHISITPHQKVNHHDHYYAYSEDGDKVSWHSPSEVERDQYDLFSKFLSSRTKEVFTGEMTLSFEDAVNNAHKISGDLWSETADLFEGEGSFGRIQDYGRWLRKEYNIHQYLICRVNRKHISKLHFEVNS